MAELMSPGVCCPRFPLRAINAALFCLAATGCLGDKLPTEHDSTPPRTAPQFDHVPPAGGVSIDVNSYVLQLLPAELFFGHYKGTQVLFAGGLAYGNAPDAMFYYDTRGARRKLAGAMPVYVGTTSWADHYTVSLLSEMPGAGQDLGLFVVRETFAYRSPPDDDYVIVKYTLYNPGPDAVTNLQVGQVFDPDLGGATTALTNVIEYLAGEELVRVRDAATPLVGGFAMLNAQTTSYSAFMLSPWGVAPTDPVTDTGWFSLLSGGIVNPQPVGPGDVRALIGGAAGVIAADEADVAAFVYAGGDDRLDLSANVAAARLKYRSLPASARMPYPLRVVSVTAPAVDATAQTEFAVTVDGVPKELVNGLDGNLTYCGTPPYNVFSATSVVPTKRGFVATFPVENLPVLRGASAGDDLVCAGRTANGVLFAGRAPLDLSPYPPTAVAQLTTVGTNVTPTWSPDGSAIAFASNRSGDFRIWRMDSSAGETTAAAVSRGPNDRAPDWSGSNIVFERNGSIVLVGENGGAEAHLNGGGANPRLSPNGDELLVTRTSATTTAIWKVSFPSAASEAQLTSGAADLHPEWSTDGTGVFFTRFLDGIFRVGVEGGVPERVTPDESADNRHPALSPDGRLMAFTSTSPRGTELVLQNLNTGRHTVLRLQPEPPSIAVAGLGRTQNLEFSPDGTMLLFVAGNHVYRADLRAILPLAHRE